MTAGSSVYLCMIASMGSALGCMAAAMFLTLFMHDFLSLVLAGFFGGCSLYNLAIVWTLAK